MTLILPNNPVPRDHLVLPDDHAHPEDNFRRYEWLSNFIIERKPEVIVKLGDSWDMPSLCSYDQGKKEFVFKNVRDDIESGHEAERIMFQEVTRYNEMQARNKKAQYKPLVVKIIGNHEVRVKKLLSYEPRWEGSVSMNDFKTRLNLNEVIIPYLDFGVIDGIAYSHLFVSGAMGRPFASARAMLSKRAMSCTMGHTHMKDFACIKKPTGEELKGLVAGCFHDPEHQSFAGRQVDHLWWNGIMYKHNVFNGEYDLEEIGINRLRSLYSNQ